MIYKDGDEEDEDDSSLPPLLKRLPKDFGGGPTDCDDDDNAGDFGTVIVKRASKDEGGRHTPFFDGYRPQFFFGTADVTGIIKCPEGVEMVMPGDNLTVDIQLGKKIAMEPGQRFAIREGGRTIGAGRITEVTK